MIKKERELRKLPRREGLLLLREKKRGFFFFFFFWKTVGREIIIYVWFWQLTCGTEGLGKCESA